MKTENRNPIEVASQNPVGACIVDQLVKIFRREGQRHGLTRPIFDVDGTRLFRASEAAEMIGCYKGTPKRWADGGWIPDTKQGIHRLFTLRQVYLLAQFYSVPKHDHDARSEVSKMIFECW